MTIFLTYLAVLALVAVIVWLCAKDELDARDMLEEMYSTAPPLWLTQAEHGPFSNAERLSMYHAHKQLYGPISGLLGE